MLEKRNLNKFTIYDNCC